MKKIFVVLVTMFVCVLTNAQTIMRFEGAGEIAVLSNGMRVNITQYPMWRQFQKNYTIQENVNKRFQQLYQDDPEEYYLQLRAYQERGGAVNMGMMGMTGMGYGYGMGMYGTGMNNSGMVYGAGGMAGATSNVQVTNQNMMATVGSGLQAHYDTGSNSLSVSGDPLMAAGRLVSFIGGSKKNKQQTRAAQTQQVQQTNGGFSNGQVLRDAQGNAYIVNNGVLVPVQSQQTRSQQQVQYQQQTTRSAQPVQQQTNNYGGVATQPVYNVASGY